MAFCLGRRDGVIVVVWQGQVVTVDTSTVPFQSGGAWVTRWLIAVTRQMIEVSHNFTPVFLSSSSWDSG